MRKPTSSQHPHKTGQISHFLGIHDLFPRPLPLGLPLGLPREEGEVRVTLVAVSPSESSFLLVASLLELLRVVLVFVEPTVVVPSSSSSSKDDVDAFRFLFAAAGRGASEVDDGVELFLDLISTWDRNSPWCGGRSDEGEMGWDCRVVATCFRLEGSSEIDMTLFNFEPGLVFERLAGSSDVEREHGGGVKV